MVMLALQVAVTGVLLVLIALFFWQLYGGLPGRWWREYLQRRARKAGWVSPRDLQDFRDRILREQAKRKSLPPNQARTRPPLFHQPSPTSGAALSAPIAWDQTGADKSQ